MSYIGDRYIFIGQQRKRIEAFCLLDIFTQSQTHIFFELAANVALRVSDGRNNLIHMLDHKIFVV